MLQIQRPNFLLNLDKQKFIDVTLQSFFTTHILYTQTHLLEVILNSFFPWCARHGPLHAPCLLLCNSTCSGVPCSLDSCDNPASYGVNIQAVNRNSYN